MEKYEYSTVHWPKSSIWTVQRTVHEHKVNQAIGGFPGAKGLYDSGDRRFNMR